MMEQLFYIFCTTLPGHVLPLALLWHFPWRSRRTALVLMLCNVLCKTAATAACIANGISFRGLEILFSFLGFVIYLCCSRLDFFRLLSVFILTVDYLLLIRGISSFLTVRLFSTLSQSWESSVCALLLGSISLPLLFRVCGPSMRQIYQTDAPRLWRVIWLVPGLLTVMTILFTNAYRQDSAERWEFLFFRVSLLICVMVTYYVLLQSLESLRRQVALEQQLMFDKELLEIQTSEQSKRGQLLMETAEQTRQMRHDLRHHLTAIQAMAGDENPRLAAYLSKLIQDIPAAPRNYCENPTVNAVVSHYATRCKREGIAFTARLTVPAQNENLDDRALCVVFANLLENGVEACGRMTGGEKFIRMNSSLEYGILTITMDNSFDGQARQEDGKFLSSKRASAPGVGLSSIRAVAKAHQGDARFEAKGTTFLSSVYCRL